MTTILTQLAVVIGIAVIYAAFTISKPKGKTPPGPKGWPIIGNIFDLVGAGNLVPTFTAWAQQYGPIVQFSLLGDTQVVISDEAMVNELFVKRGAIYSGRNAPHAFKTITQDLSIAMVGKNDTWRRERKLLKSAVSISANAKYQDIMLEEAVSGVIDLLGTPEDFSKHFIRYSHGIIARSFFGVPIKSADDEFVVENEHYIDNVMNSFDPTVYPVNIFTFLLYVPQFLVPSLTRMYYWRDYNTDKIMNLRRDYASDAEKLQANSSILAHFLTNRDEYDATDAEAGSAFFALIGGGTRSTFNALLTFVYIMMAYPEWQTKLQQHLDEVVGPNRIPAWTDIPQLPLVRAVVKEMIRYRSIAAELGIPHCLDEDDEFMGYQFKKGTSFHANYAVILTEPKMYPDTDRRKLLFNPERYLDPSYPTYKAPLTLYPNCHNYTPFGYGRRACPGYDFAERSLVLMVAMMGWACTIKKPFDEKTGEESLPDLTYESVPNPRPSPFKSRISVREGRINILKKAMKG